MLPRIAQLDREFSDTIQAYIQTRSRSSPLLSQIKSHLIHEGKRTAIRRSAAELELTKMIRAGVETKMSFDEIDRIDAAYVLTKVEEISADFERQLSTHLFQTLDEVTTKTGLRVDGGGGPLTNEKMIEMLKKLEVNFERSQDGDFVIVTAPGMVPVFERLDREMKDNPEARKRWQEVMEEKRNDFREREINRNLVG